MRLTSVFVVGLAGTAAASEAMAGAMERLMKEKIKEREEYRAMGMFGGSALYKKTSERVPCINGKAGSTINNTYACNNVDMHGFLTHQDMGSGLKEGNDVWGWTSNNGREFAAIGQGDGTAFVEVMKGGGLRYVGRLPTQTHSNIWRDIKIINGYAYIGSEAAGHGLQVFNMRKLLDVKKPVEFNIHKDLTAWYNGFGSSHNIVANEETNIIYAVGTKRKLPCRGGLFMLDVSHPSRPKWVGCASEDGYVHDAQCVIYKGPTTEFQGREICFNYNEDTLTIVDVTDKSSPYQISKSTYWGHSYTHQGWLIDDSMTYLLLDDEEDERHQKGYAANNHTTTYVVNISDLRNPVYTGVYQSPAMAVDHNQYVVNGLTYQSNYNSGLRIVDISSTKEDPTGGSFREVGFFDCHPEDDAVGGRTRFMGSWSVYPFFKSGFIILNSIERGAFSLKYNPQ